MAMTDERGTKRWRYSNVARRTWNDENFRRLSAAPPNGQTLWLRLITGPELNCIPGLFCAGEAGLAEALGWELQGLRQAFAEVLRQGMAQADWSARVVWTPNAVRYNKPESPNVVRAWAVAWEEVPECDLKREAWSALHAYCEELGPSFLEAFESACPKPTDKSCNKSSRKPCHKPSDKAPPVPCANQEQEQDQKELTLATLRVARPLAGADQASVPSGNRDESIREVLALIESLGPFSDASEMHDAVEGALRSVAFECIREVEVDDRGDGRTGRVDLVASRGELKIAFEFDRATAREKSVFKLGQIPNAVRVVVLRERSETSRRPPGVDHQIHVRTAPASPQATEGFALTPPAAVESPRTRRPRAKREKTELPADFAVTDELRAWAAAKGLPSPDSEFEKFVLRSERDNAKYSNWLAAFKLWLQRAKEYAERDTNRPSGTYRSAGPRQALAPPNRPEVQARANAVLAMNLPSAAENFDEDDDV